MNVVSPVVRWTLRSSRRQFSQLAKRDAGREFQKIQVIHEEANDGLRRIVMKDMKTRNALSLEMMTELVEAINDNKSSTALRAMTLESIPGPVFSAGHNLKEMGREEGVEGQRAIFAKCTQLMTSIRKAEVPVIGVVNGLAAAAGCQLVSSCDFAIASWTSTFSTPGANFGLFCSTPGVGVSRVVNRSTAAFMLLTGIPISAETALQSGLVSRVVSPDLLDSTLQDIYSHIQAKSRPVLKLGKEFFYHQLNLSYEHAMRVGEEVMVKNLQHPDCQEGILSFKQKRKPNWTHTSMDICTETN